MRLPPRWARRLLLTPILPIVFVSLLVFAPAVVPLGALVTTYLPGRLRVLSLTWLGFMWLLRETVVVFLLFLMWIISGFGANLDSPWFQRQHTRLIGWYLRGLVSVTQNSLGLRLVTERAPGKLVVEPKVPPRPMLIMSRHAGMGDSFLLVHLLVNVFDRRPAIVLKDTLQWLPSLDIALNRMGAAFVAPGSGTVVVDAIADLSRTLPAHGALVIFPEGGNFTPGRRVRALERLAQPDLQHLLARGEELTTVLPPRTTGVQAALDANPDADVVVVAHTGLEGYASPIGVLERLPMQHSVRLAMWHVPREEVPSERDGVTDWLFDWWERIDTWIEDHDEPGVPHQQPDAA
jgi:hypothetical protein